MDVSPQLPSWMLADSGIDTSSGQAEPGPSLIQYTAYGWRRVCRPALAPMPGKAICRGFHQAKPLLTLMAVAATAGQVILGQAVLLRSIATAVRYFHRIGQFDDKALNYYHGCLAMRRLLAEKLPPDVAAELAAVQGWDIKRVHRILVDHTGSGTAAERLIDVERWLAFAVGERKPRRRQHPASGTPSPPALPAAATMDAVPVTGGGDDPSSNPLTVSVTDALHAAPPRMGRLARGVRAVLQTQAQKLDLARPGTLGPVDGEAVIGALREAPAATRAAIAAALWGGQDPVHLLAWRVAATPREADVDLADTWLVLDPPSLVLANRVNPVLPAFAGAHLPAATHVTVSLGRDWRGVAALISHARSRAGQALFDEADLVAADALLHALPPSTGSAASLRRLGRLLAQTLRDLGGDDVNADHLSAQPPRIRGYGRLHYRQIQMADLTGAYADAATWMHARLFEAAAARPADADSAGIVGSLRVPLPEVSRAYLHRLRMPLTPRPRGRPSSSRIVAFHNFYCRYAVELLLWSTGIRPTQQGLLALFDEVDGVILVDEKHRGIAAVRAVPLVPVAGRQLACYRTHREFVIDRLGLPKVPPWFLVDARGRVRPLRPADRKPDDPTIVDNAHRHAMSSALHRMGWPGHRINLLLGHAVVGEEPGAPYSCAQPRFAPEEIASIAACVQALGLEAVEGLGNG